MAVLKDLIVHGRSRFINGAQFNTINAESIGATAGIFDKLIATTLDAKTAAIDDLTAKNATVTALLDVQGDMHTNSWSNSNIATIDGSFYITPTSVSSDGSNIDASDYAPTGTITYASSNFTKISVTGTFDTSQLTLNDNAHVPWPANSEVIITGDVLVGNEWLPLGTIRGKLESQVAASNASKTISIIPLSTSLTDGQGHTPITLETIRVGINLTSGTSSVLKMRKVKVSLTSRASGSTQYPVGILLSAQGTGTGQTFIDIYGGNNARNGQSGTINGSTKTFTKPTVRLGNLEGLPKLANQTPSGWGIYTSNGFFEGAIVAKEGYIGNTGSYWTIGGGTSAGATYMYSGPSTVSATSTAGTYLGTNGFLNTASSTTYAQITNGVLTAQGAVISGTIDATSFKARDSNKKVRAEVNTNGLLIYDSDGTVSTNGTLLAQFGSTTQIGKSAQAHINITSGGLDLYKGTTGFANLITHLGYGSTDDDDTFGDTTNIPYFTLGTRKKNQAEYATSYIPGIYSVTMGLDNVAQGSYAVAIGETTEAIGHYSYAEGSETYAIGNGSHAGGHFSEANGDYSFAHGDHTIASANFQTVFGSFNKEDLEALFIIGNGTDGNNRSNLMVIGDDYARIGNQDQSSITISPDEISGMGSEGKQFFKFANSTSSTSATYGKTIYRGSLRKVPYTLATALSVTFPSQAANSSEFRIDFQIDNGSSGIIFPYGTATTRSLTKRYNDIDYTLTITYDGAVTFTDIYLTTGHASLDKKISINGFYTIVSPAPTYILGGGINIEATGAYSIAEGYDTHATGAYSHVTGYDTYATGEYSHAEGYENKALGIGSHAEGIKTIADGYYSHAEGQETKAVGTNSHTEGFTTEAVGTNSHAEGTHSIALGKSSHAQNLYTVATEIYQTVIGKYNACTVSGSGTTTNPYTYTDAGDYAFIIGNGTSNTTEKRSNAFMVDWSGDIYPQATKMTDFIIEQGTSGIWTYRKWNSGISECWGRYTWNITTWTAWGSWYYSNASSAVNYPTNLFIEAPSLTTNGRINGLDCALYCRSGADVATNTATFAFFRPSGGTTGTGQLSLYAIGKWK